MTELIQFLTPIFTAIFMAAAVAIREGRKRIQAELAENQELKSLKEENSRLSKELEELKPVLDDLRSQMQQLSAFKALYETLSEAHTLLRNDYSSLKVTVSEQGEQISALSNDLQKSQANEVSLKHRLEEAIRENATLTTSVMVYQDALSRVNEALGLAARNQPPEAPTSNATNTKAETSEVK